MNLLILPSAWDDLADGFRFYERQAPGLGDYFRDSLIADIESLAVSAGAHRQIFGWYRSLARKFPFAIYYSLDEQTILVRAVLDCRRDPTWTRQKLR
ncbi:MAG: type II toxin-antitoxin system RelE/ParE family toxin [Opitutaceae bacterium]|nr:type II toxin-antitoxin system RelE/ParE family toxin [Opitutaceae bacterium]